MTLPLTRARVIQFERAQGFGRVRLADGRELPFDASRALVADLGVDSAVDVRLDAHGRVEVLVAPGAPAPPPPRGPEAPLPAEALLAELQSHGLATELDRDTAERLMPSRRTFDSDSAIELLAAWYGEGATPRALRDRVLCVRSAPPPDDEPHPDDGHLDPAALVEAFARLLEPVALPPMHVEGTAIVFDGPSYRRGPVRIACNPDLDDLASYFAGAIAGREERLLLAFDRRPAGIHLFVVRASRLRRPSPLRWIEELEAVQPHD